MTWTWSPGVQDIYPNYMYQSFSCNIFATSTSILQGVVDNLNYSNPYYPTLCIIQSCLTSPNIGGIIFFYLIGQSILFIQTPHLSKLIACLLYSLDNQGFTVLHK